jgi:hypothetical protein
MVIRRSEGHTSMVDWILDQVRWNASMRSRSYSSEPSSSAASTSRGLFDDLGPGEDGCEASVRRRPREAGPEEAAGAALWRTKNGCKREEEMARDRMGATKQLRF